ncbi:hypothetical protein [Paenibacillus thalictri]|uniref:Uncharacterized protein n=1 Tax=Paenibacillus thalictri TaxID=2527873 RepID=A0A4Q9DF87_9BACL|nr:hypothetical protein [Paenibacillus thalictri]TBL68603.1 hypothetical protein EYB31_37620 [Paenibacillus thalictri]
MAITPIQRITSNTSTVFGAANRAAAIAGVLTGMGGNTVNVSGAYPNWPSLAKYTNDNSTFSGVADPQTVWTSNPPVAGQTQGFAVRSNTVTLAVPRPLFVLSVAVFADNAHTLEIQSYVAGSLNQYSIITNLGVELMDGPLPLNSSFTTDAVRPYNWQNLRYYSVLASTEEVIEQPIDIFFVFSFEGVNYDTNQGINTAGLSFVANIYGSGILIPS